MIEFKEVFKSFGNTLVLNNVSLKLGNCGPIVLFGPSGSGKTTVLRLIAGLDLPDSGLIYMNEMLVSKSDWTLQPNLRGIGVAFQAPSLWPHMTVEKNIMFGLYNVDRETAARLTKEILIDTDISELAKRYPHQLSGGQSKRVALARALVCKKEYYLLDEPLSNLDEKLKDELIPFILKRVKDANAGMIYITHDMAEASKISNRIIRLENGKFSE